MSRRLDHTQALPDASNVPEQPKRLACERCRGQKLRCIRNRVNQLSCNRCERAGAVCITKPSMRMGRPGRSDSQRKGNIANRKRRQSHSVPSQQFQDFGPVSEKRSSSGTCYNSPAHDGSTAGMQNITGSRPAFASHLLAADVQEMPENDFVPFPFVGEGENNDQEQEPMSWLSYNAVEMNIPPFVDKFDCFRHSLGPSGDNNLPNMIHVGPESSPSSNRTSDSGFQNIVSDLTHLDTGTVAENEGISRRETDDLYNESVERLARLDMDIRQHLKVDRTGNQPSNEHNSMEIFPPEPTLPISHVLRGLQELQDLLQNLMNVRNARSIYGSTSNHSGLNLRGNETSGQSPAGSTHSLATLSVSSSSSGDSLLPILVNTSRSSGSSTWQTRQHHLDTPTCLLMLVCYVDLVRLCRVVFSSICYYLVASNHRAISIALSDIQISGVSLQGDQNLQILILVQVVVRMLDCIGEMLGCTDCGQRTEGRGLQPLILPKLTGIIMSEEETDKQGGQAGGIKALREDIRRLKRVLKRT
ncbi:predicted protein [Uncinocarpus reesii 1704]|uniref:Zn(2)-C6 fungal-type domain-containing protein n=1 Tax=Uncinocarpus reesii (strain UAMH 1704) TaxID=336963 RepID=C4JLU9_UNCRE|nr:uncharacterized protein UREG_03807 [Uncinocarpus reesii 1704]EEP78961.1 predicted protein [Uncinocarpus reesii 1704]